MVVRSKTIQMKDHRKSKDGLVRRVGSGKKLVVERNMPVQIKMLQVNYSSAVAKKLSNFC